jgi:hypothetical protein
VGLLPRRVCVLPDAVAKVRAFGAQGRFLVTRREVAGQDVNASSELLVLASRPPIRWPITPPS